MISILFKIISHRGNVENSHYEENSKDAIKHAISLGFDVEIDLVYEDEYQILLGHGMISDVVTLTWLNKYKEYLWCHAKTLYTLRKLYDNNFNCFYHDTDDGVLTSKGFIWTYPGKLLVEKSIAVCPELINNKWDLTNCVGICTDYPTKWENYEKD